MSDESKTPSPHGVPSTTGPKPLRPTQALTNRIVRTLLRVPGLSRMLGKRLMTLHVIGRKSGRRYDIPVAYTRHGSALLIGTVTRPWVRNLNSDTPVTADRGRGPERFAPVVHTDEATVLRLYEIIARDNRTNATFNGIGFDAAGDPLTADIHQTWQQGGVVIELRPLP